MGNNDGRIEMKKKILVPDSCDLCHRKIPSPSLDLDALECFICKKDICSECAMSLSIRNERRDRTLLRMSPICPEHLDKECNDLINKWLKSQNKKEEEEEDPSRRI